MEGEEICQSPSQDKRPTGFLLLFPLRRTSAEFSLESPCSLASCFSLLTLSGCIPAVWDPVLGSTG